MEQRMCVDESNVSDPCCSYHIYKLSFLNFLLGKQPNGPGQFMFGTVAWELDTTWLEVTASNQHSRRFHNYVLNVKALLCAFNQEKPQVGAFSVIVKSSRTFV